MIFPLLFPASAVTIYIRGIIPLIFIAKVVSMSFFSKFIPEKLIPQRFRKKKDPVEDLKQNLPKEKANIKSSFAVYCNKHHNTKDGKLCPKCTALLATILPKIARCRYGVTKPICDRCDQQCFGDANNKAFMEIMEGSR